MFRESVVGHARVQIFACGCGDQLVQRRFVRIGGRGLGLHDERDAGLFGGQAVRFFRLLPVDAVRFHAVHFAGEPFGAREIGAVHRGEHRLEDGCQFVVHGIGVPQRLDGFSRRVVFDDAVRQPHGTVIGSHVVIRFAPMLDPSDHRLPCDPLFGIGVLQRHVRLLDNPRRQPAVPAMTPIISPRPWRGGAWRLQGPYRFRPVRPVRSSTRPRSSGSGQMELAKR